MGNVTREIAVGVASAVLTAAVLWMTPKFWEWPIQQLVPSKAVMAFNQTSCPPGWKIFDLARGRYVVGLTEGGRLGRTVGRELANEEDRPTGQHDHALKDAPLGGTRPEGLAAARGNAYERERNTVYRTMESEGASGVPGTNAPYIQLLYCERE